MRWSFLREYVPACRESVAHLVWGPIAGGYRPVLGGSVRGCVAWLYPPTGVAGRSGVLAGGDTPVGGCKGVTVALADLPRRIAPQFRQKPASADTCPPQLEQFTRSRFLRRRGAESASVCRGESKEKARDRAAMVLDAEEPAVPLALVLD
jgi:hypothetical protein